MGAAKKAASSLTGGLLAGGGNMPRIQPIAAAPVPTVNDAEVQASAKSELERLKKQRGRAATILSSGDDGTVGGLATRALLGAG